MKGRAVRAQVSYDFIVLEYSRKVFYFSYVPRINYYSDRVILINDKNEILLMHARDQSTTRTVEKYNGYFWFLVGGEQGNSESVVQIAVRELWEEAGLTEAEFKLGPIVWKG